MSVQYYWVVDPRADLPPKLAPSGPGSREPVKVMTALCNVVEKCGNRTAMNVKRGGRWVRWTWREYYNDCVRCARALIHIGVQFHNGVGVMGNNCPEWVISNVAAVLAGGVATAIHKANSPDACQYIAEHSEASVVLVEDEKQLNKFLQVRERLPYLKAIVMWRGTVPAGVQGVYAWKDFMALGDKVPPTLLEDRVALQRPGHCCTLIYTAGTTGIPKACMLSQDNITWTAWRLASEGGISADDRIVSFMPLSHIAAQLSDIYLPLTAGSEVWFPDPTLVRENLPKALGEARPTLFFGIPRVWEKLEARLKEVMEGTQKGFWRNLTEWAQEVGFQAYKADQKNVSKPWMFPIANWLILNKARQTLGLDRCRLCFSAAAPIGANTLEFLGKFYIPVMELYGMSESTGFQTVNRQGSFRAQTVGVPVGGTELKIVPTSNQEAQSPGAGEVLYRGRNVMMGYMKNIEMTVQAIDEEGFLHSGDIGVLDDGFLKIVGRYKDSLTNDGQLVQPVLIEEGIRRLIPEISNVMVESLRDGALTCLLTLRTEHTPEGEPTNILTTEAMRVDAASSTVEDAILSSIWEDYIQKGIDQWNSRGAKSACQNIQKWVILPRDFSTEGGELTSTMKLKRRVVRSKYESLLAALNNASYRTIKAVESRSGQNGFAVVANGSAGMNDKSPSNGHANGHANGHVPSVTARQRNGLVKDSSKENKENKERGGRIKKGGQNRRPTIPTFVGAASG